MIEILSKNNEHFRRWVDLASSRGIRKHKEFILMGERLINEYLERPRYPIKAELLCEGLRPLDHRTLKNQNVRSYKLAKALFNEVDVIGTHSNLLVLELPEIPLMHPATKPQGLEIIAPLGDPGNLGSLARSALAFEVTRLVLTEESCLPYHPKAIKASAGALLQIPICKVESSLQFYMSGHEDIYCLDLKGEDISLFKWPQDLRLAVGEEGAGFGELKGLKRLSIPTKGVESLNATVAASIAFFSYSLRHNPRKI